VKFRSAVRALAALALVSGVVTACGGDSTAKVLSGLQKTPPPTVGALSLPDASDGDSDFSFRASEGNFLIVYFGYTACPDVCPTTLSEVKKAFTKAGDDIAERTDLAMITVDPERDDGELLTKYVRSFIDGAHALRTDDDTQLQAVAKGFGTTYSVTATDSGEPEVIHSGNLYVVDDNGDVVLEWLFGIKSGAIATDLEILYGKG
jgi:protein SCO1/2